MYIDKKEIKDKAREETMVSRHEQLNAGGFVNAIDD